MWYDEYMVSYWNSKGLETCLAIFSLKFQGQLQNPWANQSGEEAGKLLGCGLPQLWVLMALILEGGIVYKAT